MANSKNTLWAFGDSFTVGSGCIPLEGTKYYYEYPERRVERGLFVERLADHFNLNLQNLALAGSSNQMIIDDIIDNAAKFKKGDRVIVGMSDSARLETFVSRGAPEVSLYPPPGVTDLEEQGWSRFPLTHYIASTDIKYWAPFTKQQANLIQKYIVEVVLPCATYKEYHSIQQTIKLLKALKIESGYVWNASQWRMYDTIFKDTNGKIEDYHFSWKGHEDFANKVIKEWGKSKFYVDKIERIP